MRYGPDIQFIPDRTNGDGGLEAFRLDDGVVYQCYAPDDAVTISAITEGQKKKIRTDIRKLRVEEAETMRLLGSSYLIRRWVLLTPEYDDKELVKYARYKSAKVRAEAPRSQWCHESFEILVASDREMFAAELAAMGVGARPTINLRVDEPTPEQIESAAAADEIGLRLREKLMVHPDLAADEEWLTEYSQDTLWEYIYGQAQLEALRDRYSLAFDSVSKRAALVCRGLTRNLGSAASAPDLDALISTLANGFATDVPALSQIACISLARHYVAVWWIACPLRFRVAP
ncbi:hypothetical protein AB0M47_29575 [Hamadaea sp. NPDC051192]|uniref:hypothetical protein n=1 Tax=Hamadaea sp. NPDC051192 TaxID=3154940 RepID=UPI00342A6944